MRAALVILIVCFGSLALAEDFKTIDGKEYKHVTVSRVEPDGIVLSSKSGISKVYFTELPKDVQEQYHYDAQKAAEFTSQTKDKIDLLLRQRTEQAQQRAEERAKYWAEQAQIKRQQQAEIQRQQQAAEEQRRAEIQRLAPSVSKEGMPEHTYELLQDYTIDNGTWRRRLRRGERYHGRILVDHAEIDIDGISYLVPSGILSAPVD